MSNKLEVVINYIPSDSESLIKYYSSEFPNINNISSIDLLKTTFSGARPFILGQSTLNEGCQLLEKYDGIISYSNNDDNTIDYTMVIRGKNMNMIAIQFDKLLNEYATELYINDVKYENNNSLFITPLDNNYDTLTIKLTKWSKPKRSIVIDRIYLTNKKTYGNKQISNLKIGSEISSNGKKPSFSCNGRYGSFDILNVDNEIIQHINNGILNDKTKIDILLNNISLGTFYSKKWSFNESTKKVNVELNDYINNFQNIILSPIETVFYESGFSLFEYLFKFTGLKNYRMADDMKDKLSNIKLYGIWYPQSKSLLEQFNDFCELTLSNIFINSNDELEVIDYV